MENNDYKPQNPFRNDDRFSNNRSDEERKQFVSARRLTLAANIMGPISLFIGGSLLSTIGLICAILAWRKLKRLSIQGGSMVAQASQAIRATKVSIGVCAVALALNAIATILIFPEMLEMVQSGDLGSLGVEGVVDSKPTSTWG